MVSTNSRPRPSELELPPVVGWEVWRNRFLRQWKQGAHLLDVGPTQSGKSLLMRELVFAGRKNVVVMGTKPRDETLEEYIEGGFVRIDHWPPENKDYRAQQPGMARFILWPKIREVGDAVRYRPLFEKALRHIYVDVDPKTGGGWTVIIDETLFFSDTKDGLGLGHILSTMAYSSASSGITMCFLMQRPAGVPRILWQSCATAFIFHMGVTNDVREMASLGTIQPKAVTEAIQKLEGHEFLDVPCRAGRRWSKTQVELGT